MWNNLSRVLFVAALVAAGVAAYLYWVHGRDLEQNLEALKGTNHELVQENNRLKEHVVYLTARLKEDIAKVSKEKEAELDRLRHTHDDMIESLRKEIDTGEIRITRLADRLSVNIVDKILFPSGEASITPEGTKVLERVGQVLARSHDKIIRVEGHTDNVPTGKHLRATFPTNWELSAARATNVIRFLVEHAGIDPNLSEVVGMGEYHPVADNGTVAGRSQNRRIEIILYPHVQALTKDLSGDRKLPARRATSLKPAPDAAPPKNSK